MFNTEQLQEKWQPVLEHKNLPKIDDAYRRAVTSLILENQEKAIKEDNKFLSEAAPTNSGYATSTGSVQGYDPILISLVRRAMPNLIAYDIAGVQPMTGPTGLIFAMRSRHKAQNGVEAFYNEAESAFSASGAKTNLGGGNLSDGTSQAGETNPAVLNDSGSPSYTVGTGMTSAQSEALGDGATSGFEVFNEMAFSIEKHSVTAKSRALKAEYSMELAQDLKAIHGLDAETELSNILSSEILAEINREVVRTVYASAKKGAASGTTANAGIFDMDVDSNGRWSVEKFKGLMFQLE